MTLFCKIFLFWLFPSEREEKDNDINEKNIKVYFTNIEFLLDSIQDVNGPSYFCVAISPTDKLLFMHLYYDFHSLL